MESMLYVMVLTLHPQLTREQRLEFLERRSNFNLPSIGMHSIAEYWRASPPHAIIVLDKIESFTSILAFQSEWGEYFEIDICPGISAKQAVEGEPGKVTDSEALFRSLEQAVIRKPVGPASKKKPRVR